MYRWMPTVIAALALNSIATTSALTATTTLTERCTFVLGDNDTKNEARELAFVQCKRKLLEKAGSYIQSQVQVTDGRLTKEQISIYAAAILSVEVSSEKFSFRGESMVLEQTIRATVDLEDVRTRLAVIAGDRSVQAKIQSQQEQLRSLEREVANLRRELGTAKTTKAKSIRKK